MNLMKEFLKNMIKVIKHGRCDEYKTRLRGKSKGLAERMKS